MQPVDAPTRAQMISDIRALATFLEAHPELPMADFTGMDVVYFPGGDDETQASTLADVSDLLDVPPHREGDHYVCQQAFGRSAYRVVVIPAEARARHRALMSYRDAIKPA